MIYPPSSSSIIKKAIRNLLKMQDESIPRGKLRLLSYNILADCYCDARNYPTKKSLEIDFIRRF
jgi:hypothetical protein